MKNQYKCLTVTHHQKWYSKVGSRLVSQLREGPGASKGLSSDQEPWALVQTVGLEGDRETRAFTVICTEGSSRAGKQGGCRCAPSSEDGLWLMT